MPKVISYTPPWLSRPSPGFDVFSLSEENLSVSPIDSRLSELHNNGSKGKDYLGPQRCIARRGTEIFVVVGNEIHWSDLCMLKDDWEEVRERRRRKAKRSSARDRPSEELQSEENEHPPAGSHRILKAPVSEQIRQLIPSPNGQLLAILTSHTIHIAILPDSSHLGQRDSSPLRLKTHTLGPTTHVLSQSPIKTALWHPLGVDGNCLVTVTAEAVVRLWELSRENRWSFDSPKLAIDLKKLADATSAQDDIAAYGIGRNRGFSADVFEMEVASACFGGTGTTEEHGWASMTLWVAMKEGGIYALCPLLPTKWQPPPSLIPSLSTSIVSKVAALQNESSVSIEQRKYHDQQYQWISELDAQEPRLMPGNIELTAQVEIYDRPPNPGPIPKLQGPFEIGSDDLDDLEICDIHAIAAKVDVDELMFGEGDELQDGASEPDGLSASVVCILARNGRVHICLDLDGVEGQWLPSHKSEALQAINDTPLPYLELLEAFDTVRPSADQNSSWPTFTADVHSRYSFYVTNSSSIHYFSLAPWIQALETELRGIDSPGSAFRLDVMTQGLRTFHERLLSANTSASHPFAPCLVLQDSDLGYFLLTSSASGPQAVILDPPHDSNFASNSTLTHDYEPNFDTATTILPSPRVRPTYEASSTFWEPSALPNFLATHTAPQQRSSLSSTLRLTPSTLTLLTQAHLLLSQETHQIGVAVSELFSRCQGLRDEFPAQISRVRECAERVEGLEDAGEEAVARRLEGIRTRHVELSARLEKLRRKVHRSGGRELSEAEKDWMEEARRMGRQVVREEEFEVLGESGFDRDKGDGRAGIQERFQEAQSIVSDLVAQASDLKKDSGASSASGDPDTKSPKVPPDLRKARVEQIMGLLERESALVDATQARLKKLEIAGSVR